MGRDGNRDAEQDSCAMSKWYYRRLALAMFLGPRSDRWLMTRQEILTYNEDVYTPAQEECTL